MWSQHINVFSWLCLRQPQHIHFCFWAHGQQQKKMYVLNWLLMAVVTCLHPWRQIPLCRPGGCLHTCYPMVLAISATYNTIGHTTLEKPNFFWPREWSHTKSWAMYNVGKFTYASRAGAMTTVVEAIASALHYKTRTKALKFKSV